MVLDIFAKIGEGASEAIRGTARTLFPGTARRVDYERNLLDEDRQNARQKQIQTFVESLPDNSPIKMQFQANQAKQMGFDNATPDMFKQTLTASQQATADTALSKLKSDQAYKDADILRQDEATVYKRIQDEISAAEKTIELETAERDKIQTRRKELLAIQKDLKAQERNIIKEAQDRERQIAADKRVQEKHDAKWVDEIDPDTGSLMQRNTLDNQLRRAVPATKVTQNVNTKDMTEGQIQRLSAKKAFLKTAEKTMDLWRKDYTGPFDGWVTYVKNRLGGGTQDQAKFEAGVASMIEMMYQKAGKQLSNEELQKWKPTLPSIFDPDEVFPGKMQELTENVANYLSIEENLIGIPSLEKSAPTATDAQGNKMVFKDGTWQPI